MDQLPPAKDFGSSLDDRAFVDSVRAAISSDALTIERCASEMGVSRRTIQRQLAASRLTFQELVNQFRLQSAAEMLADENTSIIEIATKLGYANSANFSRAFQRLSGVTPTQFRHNFTSRRNPSDDR